MENPYAMYINCDGAMDYSSGSPGGIGFCIRFPESVPLEPISVSLGQYQGANIEMLEIEALINAMEKATEVWSIYRDLLRPINRIILITDRFGLNDEEKTSPYKIQAWRRNGWKNFEGKPIKNHKLLDSLDKARKKLSVTSGLVVKIEYRRRKFNKIADKLSKAGRKEGLPIDKLAKKGEKIGKRKFDGSEIKYVKLKKDTYLKVNVFRKDPVQEEWEVWVELLEGEDKGSKLKIYAPDVLAGELKRGNQYLVKVMEVFTHHIHIYDEPKRLKKNNQENA